MTCPFPHTTRDKVWMSLGLVAGVGFGYFLLPRKAASASTVSTRTPSVQAPPPCVVDIPQKLQIFEHVGKTGNGDAGISIAQVTVSTAMDEATQVPKFDEYVLVTSGTMVVYVGSDDPSKRPAGRTGDAPFVLTATANQMLHLPKGHLYRYNFPGKTTYVAICTPAFMPELAGRIE